MVNVENLIGNQKLSSFISKERCLENYLVVNRSEESLGEKLLTQMLEIVDVIELTVSNMNKIQDSFLIGQEAGWQFLE
jgi:hypothetical protein